MKKKILFVVSATYFIDELLTTNLLGIFQTLEDAQTAIGTDLMDHIHNIEKGETQEFSNNFNDLIIDERDYSCLIQDPNTGNRIYWEINWDSLKNK